MKNLNISLTLKNTDEEGAESNRCKNRKINRQTYLGGEEGLERRKRIAVIIVWVGKHSAPSLYTTLSTVAVFCPIKFLRVLKSGKSINKTSCKWYPNVTSPASLLSTGKLPNIDCACPQHLQTYEREVWVEGGKRERWHSRHVSEKHWNETRTRNGVSFPQTQTLAGYLPMPFFELRRQSRSEETSTDMTYSRRTFINWQVTQAEVILTLPLTISSSSGENAIAVITNLLNWGWDLPMSHVHPGFSWDRAQSERCRKSNCDLITMPTSETNLTEQYCKIEPANKN